MAGMDDHTRCTGAHCELMSNILVQKRRVQTHGVRSVKLRLARKVAQLGVEWRVAENNAKSGLSSSTSEADAVMEQPGVEREVGRGS